MEVLFGSSFVPDRLCGIGHRGQAVCDLTVTVVGKNGSLEHVRVLGPHREKTQVELAASDAFALGIQAPVRISGDLSRAGACTLVGTEGEISLRGVAIIPARHLHCRPQEAERLGIKHHDTINVHVPGRDQRIEHVSVRVHPTFALEFHLSADEAAEHWLHTGDYVTVL